MQVRLALIESVILRDQSPIFHRDVPVAKLLSEMHSRKQKHGTCEQSMSVIEETWMTFLFHVPCLFYIPMDDAFHEPSVKASSTQLK